ncbi:MAG: sel1 repeat family protein [Proteobacteria bacterium]|nr:sel1 repeat family protein [Pseudomonadota bacterium]MBU1688436.1 sel1 repeat family protein [Pseudomonadota bacterium]
MKFDTDKKIIILLSILVAVFFLFPNVGIAADGADEKVQEMHNPMQEMRDQAQQGDPQAQTYLGMVEFFGFGGAPNYEAALSWFTKAADQNYPEAFVQLGNLHELGLGVAPDLEKAIEYYQKAVAVKWPTGLFRLGLIYLSGTIAEKTAEDGTRLLQQACDGGLPTACAMGLYFDNKLAESLPIFQSQCQEGDQIACDMTNQVNTLMAEQASEPVGSAEDATRQQSSGKTIYYLLAGLIILLGGGVLVWFLSKKKVENESSAETDN